MPESLYRYIWSISRRDQIGLCVLTALVFPLSMLPLELQRRIINDAVGGTSPELLLILGGGYFAVIVVHGGLKYALNLYRGRVSERVTLNLREAIYYCIYAVVPGDRAARDEEPVDRGTVVSMLAAEVEKPGGFVGESLSQPLLQGGTIAAVLGYMVWVEPLIAFAAVVLHLPQLVVVPWIQGRINRHAKSHAERVRDLGDLVVERAETTGGRGSIPQDFARLIERILAIRMSIFRLKYFLKFFNNFLGHLGPLSVLLLGGWLVIRGRTEVGTIVAFISGFERVNDPWRQLIALYRRVANARTMYKLVVDTFPSLPETAKGPAGLPRADAER